MKVWVLVPAYNEAQELDTLLSQLKVKNLSVIVVDDGSVDDSYDIAKLKADIVLRNEKNCGKGKALQKGIMYLSRQEKFDYLLTMDADGQHSPEDIDSFLEEARKGALFVVGNRMHNPCGMPKIRVLTNKLMSLFISRIVKQYIPDTQCGYRLIKKEVLDKIQIRAKKFEIESEILIKAASREIPIKSIPIRSIYSKHRVSRINPFIDTLRFFRFIISLEKQDDF